MKILLVNTNRYRTPPVAPLALEYLASALSRTGHEYRILDLCFTEDPIAELAGEIADYRPDAAGLTIRNIDTVLASNNVFFLDDIKRYVDVLKAAGIPVILGGVGYSFVPGGILRYLGADYGIQGPGERALPKLLDALETGHVAAGTVLDGWREGIDPDEPIDRTAADINRARYVREGGLLGFETQKGCFSRCSYCAEGRAEVLFKHPDRVVNELAQLAGMGFTDFHLCDAEFNQHPDHCRAFLEQLIERNPGIRWALYMKSGPFDAELFRLLKRSGAHLVTLSLPTGPDSLESAREIRRHTLACGMHFAVDYLCGYPGDTSESVRRDIETLRYIAPDTVGVNSTLRLYSGLTVTDAILTDRSRRPFLYGAFEDNPDCIRPVFYSHITVDMLREFIGEDPRFHIEGFDRTSNYERLKREE